MPLRAVEGPRQEDTPEGMLALWSPNQSEHPAGAVLLNGDHPMVASVVWYRQSRYFHILPELIRQEIVETYAQIAVAKAAHSAQLRSCFHPASSRTIFAPMRA